MNYLDAIVSRKYREIERRRRFAPMLTHFEDKMASQEGVNLASLKKPKGEVARVIAEVKFKSPSQGIIQTRLPGAATSIALAYERAGASMISVLCDREDFLGSPLDVRRVARAVAKPVLYKEFVLDPMQIRWARMMGARAVLLIARILESEKLIEFVDYAISIGLEPLVEAADDADLEKALKTRARLIGVNARDLRSFRMDAVLARRLVDAIPEDFVAIYMSGIDSRDDLLALRESRADAVLVGESLMRSKAPFELLSDWLREP